MASDAQTFFEKFEVSAADQAVFNSQGVTPEVLKKHEAGTEYHILGITPEEVGIRHAGIQFSFSELEAEFIKVVPDYGTAINRTTRSFALDFAVKVIYEVGPASRQVKKGNTDKRWRFRFCIQSGGKTTFTTVFVASFKTAEPPLAKPVESKGQIMLTMKQASLLAQTIFSKAIRLCIVDELILMTPLCGAIFSKNNLAEISEVLFGNSEVDAQGDTLVILSQSCQSGGHYLAESSCAVAVVAAVCATRNMTDPKTRDQIINKTYKQYVAAGKPFDSEIYNGLCKFATGGVPAEHSAKRLIEKYDSVQKAVPSFQMFRAVQQSGIKTVPSNISMTAGEGTSASAVSKNA